MTTLCLIVRIGGERVALAASDVESVVEVATFTPVPRAPAHISGLSALRSRVLTVVDCRASLQLAGNTAVRSGTAVVVTQDGHPYALLVDAVEDVVESSGEMMDVHTALAGGWARAASGMIEIGGSLLLRLNIRALVAGPMLDAA